MSLKDKILATLSFVVFLLLGLFGWEQSKRKDAEAKVSEADTKKTDAVLEQHTADVQDQINKDNQAAQSEIAKPQTNEDLLKFLNKDHK